MVFDTFLLHQPHHSLDGVIYMEVAQDMTEKETEEKVSYLRKRILTLEWDKENNQLNAGMQKQHEELKKEFSRLSDKLRTMKADDAAEN